MERQCVDSCEAFEGRHRKEDRIADGLRILRMPELFFWIRKNG